MDTRLNGTLTTLRIAIGFMATLGAYVASAWLILVAINLVLGGHLDIAVRDVVLAVAAYALARFEDVRTTSPAQVADALRPRRSVTA